MRGLGIATWDTYRINQDHRIVLMTLAAKENQVLLTTNNYKLEGLTADFFEKNPVQKVENIGEFTDYLVDILEKAIQADIVIYHDCWGFIFSAVDKEGNYKIAPIISDLDSFKEYTFADGTPDYKQKEIKSEIPTQNLQNLFTSLFVAYPGSREAKNDFVNKIMNELSGRII